MRDVRRGRLRLTGSDVKAIFEPVVKEVIALVDGQIKATEARVKAVLLVGGFGQSVYLRDRIRQAVTGQGIEVMQSPSGCVSQFTVRDTFTEVMQVDSCRSWGSHERPCFNESQLHGCEDQRPFSPKELWAQCEL